MHRREMESGRNIVEIMGVLAIMGILSVVGVKAYTYAMNRHQANELIYEANKRAASVAMQIAAGKSTHSLSIDDFPNPVGYSFGVEENPKNIHQFNITIDTVDEAICKQMKTAVGTTTPLRIISENCNKLTFNNDLSTTPYTSDIQTRTDCTNAGNIWCNGSSSCAKTEEDCCAQKILGPCQGCSEGTVITTLAEGKRCDYDSNGTEGICHSGQCSPLSNTITCDENTGLCSCLNGGQLCNYTTGLCCGTNEICNSNGDVNASNETNKAKCLALSGDCTTNADCTDPDKPWCQVTEYTNCRTPSKGQCAAIEDTERTFIYGLGEVVAGPKMNWWSAKNWCEAIGKRLVNIEDFQVYAADSGILLTTASSVSTAPCRQGKSCVRWDSGDATNMWAGDSGEQARVLTDYRDESGEFYREKYSPIVLDLAKHFRGAKGAEGTKNYIWTASDYTDAGACSSYLVQVSLGYVRDSAHNNTNYVLCR